MPRCEVADLWDADNDAARVIARIDLSYLHAQRRPPEASG
jgi:hypothetical protein